MVWRNIVFVFAELFTTLWYNAICPGIRGPLQVLDDIGMVRMTILSPFLMGLPCPETWYARNSDHLANTLESLDVIPLVRTLSCPGFVSRNWVLRQKLADPQVEAKFGEIWAISGHYTAINVLLPNLRMPSS